MKYSFLYEGIFMSKKTATTSEKDITSLTQNVQQEYLKSKKDIFSYMSDLSIGEELSKTLDMNGTNFSSLSYLQPPLIVYLMGLCDRKAFETYNAYEFRFLEEEKLRNPKLKDEDIELRNPDYTEVIEYAKGKGFVIDISKIAFEKAIEVRRTAGLFEMLKTNINNFNLSIDDELHASNWYDPFSDEETEYNILNELILVQKVLPYNQEISDCLNQLVYARWQKHLRDLKKIKKQLNHDAKASLRISFAIRTLKSMLPIKINEISDKERKILLYQTIQKIKQAIPTYKEPEIAKSLEKWLNKSLLGYERSLPDSVKNAQPVPVVPGLSISFFAVKTEEKEVKNDSDTFEEEIEAQKKQTRKEIDAHLMHLFSDPEFAKLSTEEKVLRQLETYHKNVFDDMYFHLKREHRDDPEHIERFFSTISDDHKNLMYVMEFPDIYTYYMLGIISKQEADDFYQTQETIFKERAITTLDKVFDDYMQENEGDIPEEVEEAYEYYKTGKETGDYGELDFNKTLVNIGIHEEDVDSLTPSVEETLDFLLRLDFKRNIPLALNFKKEYFELAQDFKRMCTFLMLIEQDVVPCDILNLRIPDTCIDEKSEDRTRIGRLQAIRGIFCAIEDYIGRSNDFKKAKILLNHMIFASYQKILTDLYNLPKNKNSANVTPQLKAMCKYFMQKYPKTDVLKNERENMAFLANVARSCLITATAHKHVANYYLQNFDYVFGTTAKVDEIHSGKKVAPLPLKIPISDTLDEEEFDEFKTSLYERIFDEEDEKANKRDMRCIYSACSEPALLYAMGVLTNFEYTYALEIDDTENQSGAPLTIRELQEIFLKQKPPFYLRLDAEQMRVMKQIRLASSLVDSCYYYDNSTVELIDYNKKKPTSTLLDYQKNPLMAEGKMLSTLLGMLQAMPEEDIKSSEVLSKIVDSYWKESTQCLNDLVLSQEQKNPILAEQISQKREFFGLKEGEAEETISNRLKYYPKFFQMVRLGLKRNHIGTSEKHAKQLAFFEREIEAFTTFYQKQEPKLVNRFSRMGNREM